MVLKPDHLTVDHCREAKGKEVLGVQACLDDKADKQNPNHIPPSQSSAQTRRPRYQLQSTRPASAALGVSKGLFELAWPESMAPGALQKTIKI